MVMGLDFVVPLVLMVEDIALAGGTEFLLPLILGGMGAAGSMMSGGAQGKLGGYGYGGRDRAPTRGSVDPTLLGRVLAPIEQMTAVATGRARKPVTLPGAFVQPNPMFSGRGMPMGIGTTAVDPALQQPHLLGLAGVNMGAGPLSANFKSFIPPKQTKMGTLTEPERNPWGTVEQPFPQLPEAAGGMPQLRGALEMLGVHSDPMGNLTHGGQGIFKGPGLKPYSEPENEPKEPPPKPTCRAGEIWLNGRCQPIEPEPDLTQIEDPDDCVDEGGHWNPDVGVCEEAGSSTSGIQSLSRQMHDTANPIGSWSGWQFPDQMRKETEKIPGSQMGQSDFWSGGWSGDEQKREATKLQSPGEWFQAGWPGSEPQSVNQDPWGASPDLGTNVSAPRRSARRRQPQYPPPPPGTGWL